MFEVIAVYRNFLTKTVELRAVDGMSGVKCLITGAGHGLAAQNCAYSFPQGMSLTLTYPFWKPIRLGDRVNVETVLNSRAIQRDLIRRARAEVR